MLPWYINPGILERQTLRLAASIDRPIQLFGERSMNSALVYFVCCSCKPVISLGRKSNPILIRGGLARVVLNLLNPFIYCYLSILVVSKIICL
jgi:hypothetical protein